jgi:hypothetical protein
MRGLARRLRSNFGIRSSRVAIRSQLAWYWRWALNLLMMLAVAGVVWWFVENSHRITGASPQETRERFNVVMEEKTALKRELDAAKAILGERDRQAQIDKAVQGELARTVAQLQEENAQLKEDLGFLRNLMSGSPAEGIGITNLKVEKAGKSNEFRYQMLLTQGGQRKQDFRGKVQLVARVSQGDATTTLTFPEGEDSTGVEFRFYHKVEGRFRIPEEAALKSVEVRVIALPGGQVKLSRTLNIS